MQSEHGVILLETDMQEIVNIVREMIEKESEESFIDNFGMGEDEIEPCPTCGDIDGMRNPCCAGFDPLHRDNCGYG